jgi:hypothetical protein
MRESLDWLGFLSLGLLGGFGHCLGMCGPFVLYVSRRFVPEGGGRARLLGEQGSYSLGRIVTYTALGALAGGLGSVVDLAGSMAGVQHGAGIVAGLVLVLFGGAALAGLLPGATQSGGPLFARVAAALRRRAPGNAFVTGLALGLLPCGLVWAALIAAAGQGSVGGGALGAALFGAGTMPALLALAVADAAIARARPWLNRLSFAFVLVMGIVFIGRGVLGVLEETA